VTSSITKALAQAMPTNLEAAKALPSSPAAPDLFMSLSYRCFAARGGKRAPRRFRSDQPTGERGVCASSEVSREGGRLPWSCSYDLAPGSCLDWPERQPKNWWPQTKERTESKDYALDGEASEEVAELGGLTRLVSEYTSRLTAAIPHSRFELSRLAEQSDGSAAINPARCKAPVGASLKRGFVVHREAKRATRGF